MSFTVASLVVVALTMPMPNSETPTQIVEHLLEASAKGDWLTALAMLTSDAQFGVGDIGGPLNEETVSVLGSFEKHGCRTTSTRETDQRDRVQEQVRFVEVRRTCPYGDKSGQTGEHELVSIYFVKGKKIAGLYIKSRSAPPLP